MKAALARAYGGPDVITLEEIPAPVAPPGWAEVAVRAAAVTRGDARIRAAAAPPGLSAGLRLAFGLRRPRKPVLGMMFCGTLCAPVAGFAAGARVLGNTGLAMGAHAERLVIAPERLFAVPEGWDDAEAAALLFGALTAADFLIDKARLAPGARVLINGATGEVGCAALQIARFLGAEITARGRAENHDLARDLGAHRVLDYRDGPPRGAWDLVLDIAGTLPWPAARAIVAPGGMLAPVTASLGTMLGAGLRPHRAGGRRISATTTAEGPAAMARVIALCERGALRPVVGARLPFDAIAQAHARADSPHKRGAVVVLM